jgi:hypothetical protein
MCLFLCICMYVHLGKYNILLCRQTAISECKQGFKQQEWIRDQWYQVHTQKFSLRGGLTLRLYVIYASF